MSRHSEGILKKMIKKGSLICVILIIISSQAALAASSTMELLGIPEPQEMSIDTAKNSIVRVIAGVENDKGKIKDKSKVSGFIISNDYNNVYIVTTLHAVDLGDKGRIRIAVKNDSVVDAEIVQKNKENDFCILAAENSFNDKNEIALRVDAFENESDRIKVGEEVMVLGFTSETGNSSDFDSTDVASTEGTIVDIDENEGHIIFDASMPEGTDGGVLIDKDGYAIGLLNQTIGASAGLSAAKDISEIDEMLVRTNISYRSKDKDLMYRELYDLCNGAEDLYKRANKDTKQELYRTVNAATSTLQENPYDREALAAALEDLNQVTENANLKIPKLLIVAYVLAGIIMILFVRLISLMLWNKKHSPAISSTPAVYYREPHAPKESQLRVIRTGQTHRIDKSVVTIGKSSEADIVISDNNKVSRRHASVENRNGVYMLRDLNSTNGTYLNNRRVDNKGVSLKSGDIIGLAGEQIEFLQW